MGNVTKVEYRNFTNTNSYVSHEVFSYDNKPNFIGGNKWLKFILLNTGVNINYYFRMFSKNNSLYWNIDFGDGFKYLFTADYTYNNYGFANKAVLHTNIDIDFNEMSSSTCDAAVLKSKAPLMSKNLKLPFKSKSQLPVAIPHQ